MSFYRLLNAPLACGFCQTDRPATIQFRTGGEDNLESYDAGVPVPVNHGMPMDTPFTAHTDRYCPACLKLRKSEETRGLYLALASLIDAKRLEVEQPGFLFKKPVTPAMLRERADIEAPLMQTQPPAKYKHLFSRLEDYQMVFDNRVMTHGTPEYNAFIEVLNQHLADHLKRLGWSASGLIRHDLEVILTPDQQLILKTGV